MWPWLFIHVVLWLVTSCACTSSTWMLWIICCASSSTLVPALLPALDVRLFMKRLSKMATIAYPNFPALLFYSPLLTLCPQTLLDMDGRFGAFFPRSFYLYNMMTGMTVLPDHDDAVQQLLQRCDLIIIDPPFSAPLPALAATLSHTQRRNPKVKLMLLFPYYEQKNVEQTMPFLHMLDYRVKYCDHKNYKGEDTPVRIFTNIPLPRVPSPQEAGYKLCLYCNDWMFHTNVHCKDCNKCTSVGGVVRQHCSDCRACVKLGSLHCPACSCCHPKNSSCPPVSRCTVCASAHHRRHACPQFQELVKTALKPWAITPRPLRSTIAVSRHTRQIRPVGRAVCKRPHVFIFAHILSRPALLNYCWRKRRSKSKKSKKQPHGGQCGTSDCYIPMS